MSRPQLKTWLQLLAGLFLLLNAGAVQAQIAPDSAQLAVKLALVRLLSSTYEAEVEYRCAPRLSVSLLPRVVAGTAVDYSTPPSTRHSDDHVRGVGLGLGSRYYIPNTGTEGAKLAGVYLGLKAEYQHLRLSYQQEGWGEDPSATDGLLYYKFRLRDYSETINRYGGAATLGYQCQVFHPRLRFDTFLSLNALNSRSSAGEASRYRSARADYGHSGTFWTMGVSLGFVVK
ncbi:hypothetical protein AUC43_01305 [Hymenobacter sedentarius]|uniref:Outer membrane protein beta-barrel domain-containing protein n=1 Tax=Hymenobacter sedentarius TaxID=1411621 RepID=A0A0U4BYR1_9BACT|nr:DUF3575 domain-containing protein [Hymenobacter sedentarius]ALW83858.1 hypothetical protein AUC43_01305 [Hymenobacter sedentarius]